MSINKDEFVDFLENYLMEEEAKELEITITGDEAQDAPMIDSRDKANYFLKLMNNIKIPLGCNYPIGIFMLLKCSESR